MSTADGQVGATEKIIDNGANELRWNLVLLADGYRAVELPLFAQHAQDFATTLLATPPFDKLKSAINLFRVNVSSTDSGADDPIACGGPGVVARTYFDASFCNDGIERLLEVDTAAALQLAGQVVPQYAMVLVMVNSPTYGGSGGSVAVFSQAVGANEIALHEMGHTAFGLADEYESWAGCGVDTDHDDQHQPADDKVARPFNDPAAAHHRKRGLLKMRSAAESSAFRNRRRLRRSALLPLRRIQAGVQL